MSEQPAIERQERLNRIVGDVSALIDDMVTINAAAGLCPDGVLRNGRTVSDELTVMVIDALRRRVRHRRAVRGGTRGCTH